MKPIEFAVDPGAPPLLQAAALGLALMKYAKVSRWADLVADPSRLEGVTVTAAHVALLNAHSGVLTMLQPGPPLVTVAVCPECSKFTIVSGSPSTTCSMTLGCKGHPVRASIATRVKPAATPAVAGPASPALAADRPAWLELPPGDEPARAELPSPHISSS